MSDTRMICKNKTNCIGIACEIFRINPYRSYSIVYNSKKNSRGVGILFANNLSYTILEERRDEEDNWLLVKCLLAGKTCILGAIYGPNQVDENFFTGLANALSALGPHPIILGGGLELHF